VTCLWPMCAAVRPQIVPSCIQGAAQRLRPASGHAACQLPDVDSCTSASRRPLSPLSAHVNILFLIHQQLACALKEARDHELKSWHIWCLSWCLARARSSDQLGLRIAGLENGIKTFKEAAEGGKEGPRASSTSPAPMGRDGQAAGQGSAWQLACRPQLACRQQTARRLPNAGPLPCPAACPSLPMGAGAGGRGARAFSAPSVASLEALMPFSSPAILRPSSSSELRARPPTQAPEHKPVATTPCRHFTVHVRSVARLFPACMSTRPPCSYGTAAFKSLTHSSQLACCIMGPPGYGSMRACAHTGHPCCSSNQARALRLLYVHQHFAQSCTTHQA
jgi:hypothetical protein